VKVGPVDHNGWSWENRRFEKMRLDNQAKKVTLACLTTVKHVYRTRREVLGWEFYLLWTNWFVQINIFCSFSSS